MNIRGINQIMIALLFIIGIMLFGNMVITAMAEDKAWPISFYHLRTTSENSALSGKCTGDTSSSEIDCYLVQTRVRQKLDPKELPQKLKEIEAELEKAKKETEEIPHQFYDSFCAGFTDKSKREKIDKKLKDLKNKAPQTYAGILEIKSICKKPSYEKILRFLKKSIEAETRTCLVSSNTDFETIHLKKITPRKWLGTAGPSGSCNVVTTWTLEHEPNSAILWTFTQIRSHADQTSILCDGIEVGKPLIYSWKAEPIEMKCDFIDFIL